MCGREAYELVPGVPDQHVGQGGGLVTTDKARQDRRMISRGCA